MGSVASRKYKDPLDRGVVCSDRSVVSSDISLWVLVWLLEIIETSPDMSFICSDVQVCQEHLL